MKKIILLCAVAVLCLALPGCGGKESKGGSQDGAGTQYAAALDVLHEVVNTYGEEELFAMYGGDQEHAVMDAPGEFDVSKTEELKSTLGLPEDQFSKIENAASMVHMMNVNTFTGAAYRLKDGTDIDEFAEAVKSNLLATQWLCGQPDTLLILNVDGTYVITAYGEAGIMETFKEKALSALSGSKVVAEEQIV